jgi:RNA polymerase sigma-70 factor (ECF subfamily)
VSHTTEDLAGGVVDRSVVARALGAVSPDHRTAIVETYLRDRSYADVAQELGVSVSTLRSRVFYGLKQLRVVLDSMEVQR